MTVAPIHSLFLSTGTKNLKELFTLLFHLLHNLHFCLLWYTKGIESLNVRPPYQNEARTRSKGAILYTEDWIHAYMPLIVQIFTTIFNFGYDCYLLDILMLPMAPLATWRLRAVFIMIYFKLMNWTYQALL